MEFFFSCVELTLPDRGDRYVTAETLRIEKHSAVFQQNQIHLQSDFQASQFRADFHARETAALGSEILLDEVREERYRSQIDGDVYSQPGSRVHGSAEESTWD